MALNANSRASLQRANPARISTVFADLPAYWGHRRWLSNKNRYATECVKMIGLDTAPGGTIKIANMESYIAASSVIHCMDGWSYVSRAVEAELAGDVDAARHLAYYAELRAAMSILATEGIGVFKRKHIIITAKKKFEIINGSTHEVVWDALEFWATQSAAKDLVLKVIEPGGKPIAEWMRHFSPTVGASFSGLLASDWLRRWGLDLQRLASDREARNESSYRPTSLVGRRHLTLNQSLKFLEDFWKINEPLNSNPFREMDRQLLRRSFAMAFRATTGKSAQKAPAQLARLIEPVLHAVLPTPGDYSEDEWREFLDFRRPSSENQVIALAEGTDTESSESHHLQVLARATILLRLATGAVRIGFKELESADLAKLSFWWMPIGELKGFWEPSQSPALLSDLWDDIEVALSETRTWMSGRSGSRKGLIEDISKSVCSLSSSERVALWSLGL